MMGLPAVIWVIVDCFVLYVTITLICRVDLFFVTTLMLRLLPELRVISYPSIPSEYKDHKQTVIIRFNTKINADCIEFP
jgi:hypothetical protein